VGSRGTDDRTGLELALVQAVVGKSLVAHLTAAPFGVAVGEPAWPERSRRVEPHGKSVVNAVPGVSRRASASSKRRRETSVADSQEQGQGKTGEDTAVVEDDSPPALPRQLDALQEHWADVLVQVRRMGHGQVQALLRSCTPVAVDERQVILSTRYGFHRDRLASDDVRQSVEQALAKMIGEPVALQVVLAEKEPVSSLPGLSRAEGSKEPALSCHPELVEGLSKGQQKLAGTGSLAGLPPELTDDPLVRVAVQELGAVARTL